jgi:FkbM family methyltransferase
MTFYTPNEVCRYRAETFTTKEPETLQWIDSFGNDGVLYDIGANVGLYSVYFGLTHGGMTFAFEPSVFNVALLAKNVSANGLSDRVVIVPIPLTEANEIASFNMTSTDEGGALSTFGHGFGHDGQPIQPVMRYMTMGFSLDFLREVGAIQHPPTLIKIDVDGIEHLILRGAIETLKSPTLKSILIEVNDDFLEQALHVDRILQGAGFVRKEKTHSDMAELGAFGHTYNQIWLRA